jgi:hypothetical protein
MFPRFKGLPAITISAALLIAIQQAGAQTDAALYSFCSQSGCPGGTASAGDRIMDKTGQNLRYYC